MLQTMNVCGVCTVPVESHTAYSRHLHRWKGIHHRGALAKYKAWLATFLTTHRCFKCRGLYQQEPRKGTRSGPGLCPRCRDLKDTLSGRAYEALDLRPPVEEPIVGWESLVVQQDVWTPHPALCDEVLRVTQGQEKMRDAMRRLGITYNLFKAVGVYVLGEVAYADCFRKRKWERTSKVGQAHADAYRALTPDQKAAVLQRRFPRVRSKIEIRMSDDLADLGEKDIATNQWQSIPVNGVMVPREADIKLPLGDGRKLVILCDGEAFHGPRCIFGNAIDRIHDDTETAQAYFAVGYSVLRYAEIEILTGAAKQHLALTLPRLRAGNEKVLRMWHPPQEVWE